MIWTEHENRHNHVSREEGRFETATLKPWQEVVGRVKRLSFKGSHLEVEIATRDEQLRLSFETDSPEGDRIRRNLLSCPVGSLVGLLRTDSESDPILIRTITE